MLQQKKSINSEISLNLHKVFQKLAKRQEYKPLYSDIPTNTQTKADKMSPKLLEM